MTTESRGTNIKSASLLRPPTPIMVLLTRNLFQSPLILVAGLVGILWYWHCLEARRRIWCMSALYCMRTRHPRLHAALSQKLSLAWTLGVIGFSGKERRHEQRIAAKPQDRLLQCRVLVCAKVRGTCRQHVRLPQNHTYKYQTARQTCVIM